MSRPRPERQPAHAAASPAAREPGRTFAFAVAVAVVAGPPVELTREQAARLAREELADPAYHPPDRPLLARLIEWVVERVQELIDAIGTTAPGGWYGVLGLVLVAVAAAVVVVRWRLGPVRRRGAVEVLFDSAEAAADAAEHRRRARAATAREAYEQAVREWLRAVVRELEERGLLEARAGRTADEAARTAGAALPALAADLRAAARRFDEVAYGGRSAGPADAAALEELDAAVRAAARTTSAPGGAAAPAAPAAPR